MFLLTPVLLQESARAENEALRTQFEALQHVGCHRSLTQTEEQLRSRLQTKIESVDEADQSFASERAELTQRLAAAKQAEQALQAQLVTEELERQHQAVMISGVERSLRTQSEEMAELERRAERAEQHAAAADQGKAEAEAHLAEDAQREAELLVKIESRSAALEKELGAVSRVDPTVGLQATRQ